jgi:hypothetical protein
VAPAEREHGEGDRLRRQSAVMRFLAQMHEIAGERELVQSVIQAAAVWYDLDARAYRRDASGRFVMDMWLPGAEPGGYPAELDCSAFVGRGGSIRVSSIGDLEQLGWRGFQGEVVLLPVAVRQETAWLIVIAGTVDREAEANLAVACQMAGAALEQLGARQAHEVQARLARRIADGEGLLTLLAQAAFEELLAAVSGARGRLVVTTPGEGQGVTLAVVGSALAATPLSDVEPGQTEFGPETIVTVARLSGGGAAAAEFRAFDRVPFTRGQALLAEAGMTLIGSWLSGVTSATGGRFAEQAGEVRPAPTLEDAIGGEMERVKRLSLKGGVLVASFAGGGAPGERAVASLIEAMRGELRSSDLLGQLSTGEIAALLVRASADGVVSAAWRVRKRLEALARERRLPPIELGHALYPEGASESLNTLVERARSGRSKRSEPAVG